MTSSIRTWVAQSPPVEWLMDWSTNNFRELLMATLRQGPVPQHIAFVMDGNRRYARSKKKEVIEGHSAGFEALARTLEICYKIGVKVVTVYAFSIENFKRTKYEVDALMDMAKTRLCQFAEHGELLQRYGARLRFLGKREILRPDVLAAIDHAIDLTRGNGRAILNICAPYTSREEMAKSVRDTAIQYCQPLRPRLKRPFSETHITRNIRAQRLSQTGEKLDRESAMSTEQPPQENALEEEEYVYKPNLPEAQQAFDEILSLVSCLLDEASDEHTASADDTVIAGAANSILYHLKDGSITEEDKHAEVSDVVGAEISPASLKELQQLADKLVDYAAADEQTLASESTTLNASTGDQLTTQQQQTVKYPDVERITAETLTANTYTGLDTPPLDILVRTSGVERLSDFMLWQCHQDTEISFLKCYWPDFGLRQLVPIILEWQWRQKRDSYWNDARAGWHKSD